MHPAELHMTISASYYNTQIHEFTKNSGSNGVGLWKTRRQNGSCERPFKQNNLTRCQWFSSPMKILPPPLPTHRKVNTRIVVFLYLYSSLYMNVYGERVLFEKFVNMVARIQKVRQTFYIFNTFCRIVFKWRNLQNMRYFSYRSLQPIRSDFLSRVTVKNSAKTIAEI